MTWLWAVPLGCTAKGYGVKSTTHSFRGSSRKGLIEGRYLNWVVKNAWAFSRAK